MATVLNIDDFLQKATKLPVIDVRTPAEYAHGHISGAFNLPIFSNEERAIVGTIYKQQSREKAMMKALEIVGPKLKSFAQKVNQQVKGKELLVHCWRGGMRSNSMAWLFETVGYKAYTLKGGYKSFRHKVLDSFHETYPFVVVGGLTGTGKTDILHQLAEKGYQVLDLEGIAHHKGSAFGGLGQPEQPTTEHFENQLFDVLSRMDKTKPILTENESHSIGRVFVPNALFDQIVNAPTLHLELTRESRIDRLVNEYSIFPTCQLQGAINKIKKRLGGLNTKRCLDAIESGDYRTVAELTLLYYDKAYHTCLAEKAENKVRYIMLETSDALKNAKQVGEYLTIHHEWMHQN